MRYGLELKEVSETQGAKRAFTLIEIIVTIALLAIIMIPVGLIMIEYVRAIASADDTAAALNLANREMAIVNNLTYTDSTLAGGYNTLTTNYAGSKFDLRREVYDLGSGVNYNRLKYLKITVYPNGSSKRIVELPAYVTAESFGAGNGGNYTEKASFSTVNGTVLDASGTRGLINLQLVNSSMGEDITIIGVYIQLKPYTSSGITSIASIDIKSLDLGINRNLFRGTVAGNGTWGVTIGFGNLVLTRNTTYKNPGFSITIGAGSAPIYSLSYQFIFKDGSKSILMTKRPTYYY